MADNDLDVMSLLTGGSDIRTMVKETLKKYKGVIMLIFLLLILGGWGWMAGQGYSSGRIAYTFLGACIVAFFIIKMFMNWLKGSPGSAGSPGISKSTSDDVLIERRVEKQQEIDDLDVLLDERAKKLRSDAKKITQAKKSQQPKKSKKPKENAGDGHRS